MWDFTAEHFSEYIGTGLIFVYYLACIVRMIIVEKRKEYRMLFIYMPAVILVLFFNPFVAKMMQTYADEEVYYRIMWLIPVSVTISYTVVDLYCNLKGKLRGIVLVLSAIMIITGGKLIYTDTAYSVAENEYHVPQSVVDVCDAIISPGREIRAAFPTEMLVYVRQYTPMVVMPYGYEEIKYYKHAEKLYAQVMADEPEAEILFVEATQKNCNYVVMDETKKIIGNPEDYGFCEYKHVDGYVIFRSLTADFSF